MHVKLGFRDWPLLSRKVWILTLIGLYFLVPGTHVRVVTDHLRLFFLFFIHVPSLHPVSLTSAIIGIGGVGCRKSSKCKCWKAFYLRE